MIKQYGISEIKSTTSEKEKHCESIRLKGYTLIPSVIHQEHIKPYTQKIEHIYEKQKLEFGEDNLKAISELDVVRLPLVYDESFLTFINQPVILDILQAIFQNQFILHLQNAIINRPKTEHHQTSWHRDIPYQEYTTSKPIAINVFYCLSPFNAQTGATKILPYSHLKETFPSIEFAEHHAVYVEANPGDVVIFDSWLYHRASVNTSDIVRYGLNHVFTLPILKQQIDIPKALNGKHSETEPLKTLLGYTFQTPESVVDFRRRRFIKLQ